MSEELQKEIDRLKAENAKLARDLAGAHEDIKEVRGEARDRRHEGKKLAEQLEAAHQRARRVQAQGRARPRGPQDPAGRDGGQAPRRCPPHRVRQGGRGPEGQ